ncbi:MAG: efflux RND transporter periplasmic adaptor subunit [Pseudomonadota bacterium]
MSRAADLLRRGAALCAALAAAVPAAAQQTGGRGADAAELAAAVCAAPAEGFAKPSAEIDVAAAEAGVLARLDARPGDLVAAGDLLGRLDGRLARAELAAAQARAAAEGRLDLARTRAEFAAKRMAEVDKLRRSGAIRPMEILEAEAEAAVAAAEVEAARDDARLAGFDAARARTRLERLEIRAPADGVVDEVHREAGEFVGAGDPRVLTLIVLDPIEVDAWWPAACLEGLSPGDPALVTAGRGAALAAEVRDVGRRIDAPTGLLRVGLSAANPDGAVRAGDRLQVALERGGDASAQR